VGTVWEQHVPAKTRDNSGYNLASVAYEIVLAPGAATDMKSLSTPARTGVKDAIERHLRHAPTKVSKSRVKRLRGLSQPQYRLRVGDIRVCYDVTETQVQILAIVTKEQAQAWLDEQGTSEGDATSGGAGGGEG
jgi:mRNA-degrading endonuclease RelE of RelBE toxin-antitoxin system